MSIYKLSTNKWFLERVIFLIAGIFVLASVLLGAFVSKYFLIFTGLVGAMLINFAFSGICPMAIFLDKIGIKERQIKNN